MLWYPSVTVFPTWPKKCIKGVVDGVLQLTQCPLCKISTNNLDSLKDTAMPLTLCFSKVLLQSPVTWEPGKSLSYGSGARRPTEGWYLSRLDLAPRISITAVIWILSLNWTYGQLYEQTTTYQVSSRLQRWPNLRVTSGELTNHSYLGIRHNTGPTKVKPIHETQDVQI